MNEMVRTEEIIAVGNEKDDGGIGGFRRRVSDGCPHDPEKDEDATLGSRGAELG